MKSSPTSPYWFPYTVMTKFCMISCNLSASHLHSGSDWMKAQCLKFKYWFFSQIISSKYGFRVLLVLFTKKCPKMALFRQKDLHWTNPHFSTLPCSSSFFSHQFRIKQPPPYLFLSRINPIFRQHLHFPTILPNRRLGTRHLLLLVTLLSLRPFCCSLLPFCCCLPYLVPNESRII